MVVAQELGILRLVSSEWDCLLVRGMHTPAGSRCLAKPRISTMVDASLIHACTLQTCRASAQNNGIM